MVQEELQVIGVFLVEMIRSVFTVGGWDITEGQAWI